MRIPTPHWRHLGGSHHCRIDYTVSSPRLSIEYRDPLTGKGGCLFFDAREMFRELGEALGVEQFKP